MHNGTDLAWMHVAVPLPPAAKPQPPIEAELSEFQGCFLDVGRKHHIHASLGGYLNEFDCGLRIIANDKDGRILQRHAPLPGEERKGVLLRMPRFANNLRRI